MMQHMMLLDIQPEFAFEIEMMNRIMRHVIEKIPGKKAGKERHHICIAKESPEHKIKQSSQWNAHCRNHYQSPAITWIIMMNSMKNKMQPLTDFSRRKPMENKPV